MSWNIAIFVAGASSQDALAREVSHLLDINLECAADGANVLYKCLGSDFELLLYEDHDMENDRDMNFEDYMYEVSFWRLNLPDREKAQANTLRFAWFAFNKLKEAGQYSLMLVENTQRKLAEFNPD